MLKKNLLLQVIFTILLIPLVLISIRVTLALFGGMFIAFYFFRKFLEADRKEAFRAMLECAGAAIILVFLFSFVAPMFGFEGYILFAESAGASVMGAVIAIVALSVWFAIRKNPIEKATKIEKAIAVILTLFLVLGASGMLAGIYIGITNAEKQNDTNQPKTIQTVTTETITYQPETSQQDTGCSTAPNKEECLNASYEWCIQKIKDNAKCVAFKNCLDAGKTDTECMTPLLN